MKKTVISLVASSVVAGVILTGCGSSSSSGGTDSTYSTLNSGKDLYPVVNAKICLDDDGVKGRSAADTCKVSDENGAATFDVTNKTYKKVYYVGGEYTDESGKVIQAPIYPTFGVKGKSVINTVTDEVAKKIDENESLSVDDALNEVVTELNNDLTDANITLTIDDLLKKPSKNTKIADKKTALVEAIGEIKSKSKKSEDGKSDALDSTKKSNLIKVVAKKISQDDDNATDNFKNYIDTVVVLVSKIAKDNNTTLSNTLDNNTTSENLFNAYNKVIEAVNKSATENNVTVDLDKVIETVENKTSGVDFNDTNASNGINISDINATDIKAPEANEIATLSLGSAKTLSIGSDTVTVDEQGLFTHTRDVLTSTESLGDFFNISFDTDLSSIDANVTDSNATLKASIIDKGSNNEISINMPVQITTTVSDNNNTLTVKVPSGSTVNAFGDEIGLLDVTGTTNSELDLTASNGTVSFDIDSLKAVFSNQSALENYLSNLTQKAGKEGKYLVTVGLDTESNVKINLPYTPELGAGYKGLQGTVTLDYNAAQENASNYLENIDILHATKSELETMETKLQEIIDSSASTQAQVDMAQQYKSQTTSKIENFDSETVTAAINSLENDLGHSISTDKDLTLPTSLNNATISWESNNTSVITNTGDITQTTSDQVATLTATVVSGDQNGTFSSTVTVLKEAFQDPYTSYNTQAVANNISTPVEATDDNYIYKIMTNGTNPTANSTSAMSANGKVNSNNIPTELQLNFDYSPGTKFVLKIYNKQTNALVGTSDSKEITVIGDSKIVDFGTISID